jgi:uncharacterized protein
MTSADLLAFLPLAFGLLATGVIAGLLAGLLGVGGGIVIVPVLFHIFTGLQVDDAIRMHLAVGTSLATIIPTSIRSMRAHARKGAVDYEIMKVWGPPILIGVAIGAWAAAKVDGSVLTAIFATFALLAAFNLAFGKDSWRLGPRLPSPPVQGLLAGSMGVLSTMMGIGAGTFGVTIMTLYNVAIHRAVGTAAGLGMFIAIPGTIGFLISGMGVEGRPLSSIGYINLIGFALIASATVVSAPWGVKLAHALPKDILKKSFAFFLVLTSLRMFWSLMT